MSVFIKFFSVQKPIVKALIVLLSISIITAVYFGFSNMYLKYQYYKDIEIKLKKSNKKVKQLEQLEKKMNQILKEFTENSKDISSKIDKKLKEDEDKINDITINTNNELTEYISKHQKR